MCQPRRRRLVDVPARKRGSDHVIHRHDGELLLQLLEGAGSVQAETADSSPAQSSQVSTDADRGPEISGKSTDVSPSRAADADIQEIAAPGQQDELLDAHWPRRQLDGLAAWPKPDRKAAYARLLLRRLAAPPVTGRTPGRRNPELRVPRTWALRQLEAWLAGGRR